MLFIRDEILGDVDHWSDLFEVCQASFFDFGPLRNLIQEHGNTYKGKLYKGFT